MKLNRITALLMLSSLPLLANSASYDVVELPSASVSLNQFGSAIDETGLVLTTAVRPFNPPIDLSLIDLSIFTMLNDPQGAALGDFEEEDYKLIATFLVAQNANQQNSLFGQKLATELVYSSDGTSLNYVNGLDEIADATNGFTFAQGSLVGDSVNGTHIVGTMAGPFSKIPYTNNEGVEQVYNLNMFSSRGFVQVGNAVTQLVPENTEAGGFSTAQAINAGLQIAGSTSIGPTPVLVDVIANCADDELRPDEPIEACLYKLRIQSGNVDSFRNATTERAAVWQVDANGAVISKTIYGLVFEPQEESRLALSTSAIAINDNGVAVGVSDAPFFNRTDDTAVIFEKGQTIRIIEDVALMPNAATGINNEGLIIGFQRYLVGRDVRTKMFTFDRKTDVLTFVDGFFVNSSTIPRAINNNNLVVGEADRDAGIGLRQKSGFLYDINTNTFSDLNSLLACDANFTIVAANDINDSGEIIASALVRRPARDVKGEETEGLVDTVIAVKLMPTGQEPSDCGPSEDDIFAIERQGASVGFLTLLGLLVISVFRRRT